MSSAPDPGEIWRDAAWLVQALDPPKRMIRVVRLGEADYRSASFLDDRIVDAGAPAALLSWDAAAGAAPPQSRSDARWIFHTGHSGSTLVSRLLGELASVLAIREPRSLRDLTFFSTDVRVEFIPPLRALMSRTFGDQQTAVVKATSMVGDIAAELIGGDGRALFLYVSPSAYIAGLLAGHETRADVRRLADYRTARLARRGIRLSGGNDSDASVAAAAWACEMVALEANAAALSAERTLWVDFDRFLNAPDNSLERQARFLGLEAGPDEIAAIAGGPLLNRYSKAPELSFGPAARRGKIAASLAHHRADIEAALAMLERAAQDAPLIASALSRSSEA